MLIRAVNPEKGKIDFGYDPLGRRTTKIVKNNLYHYLWAGNVVLHEWLETKEEARIKFVTWIYEDGSFIPVAKLLDNENYSIVSDYLGTPTHAYSSDGSLAWERELDIYGRPRKGDNEFIPFLYQGQYFDKETGLAYNRFRYYDPSIGSYISQDPIGIEGGLKHYSYSSNVNLNIDIFGLAHTAIWSHTRGGIRIGPAETMQSGCDIPPGRRLTFNEQLAVHTETKILDKVQGKVQPGDTIFIKGTKPPCNPGKRGCQDAMEKFAKKHDVTIIYSDGKQKWRYNGH